MLLCKAYAGCDMIKTKANAKNRHVTFLDVDKFHQRLLGYSGLLLICF
ncbi:hypothetical protein NSIN_40191 [Nitrosotalea sinensis]|uniref:Uncharacterized protein n=1 Tax=Nitrosotalea sinensis TaxID=1499975 RepID=A0A2H1EIM1_9ARCH|nr:hypothetical protein NSIN_40191 [Candidatus Nitrosotalea sinensis]